MRYPKILFITLLLISVVFIIPAFLNAGSVIFKWDASPDPDVTGYILIYGTSPDNLDQSIDVGNVTEYELSGLTPGITIYGRVKAYDANMVESELSQGAYGEVPLKPPFRLGR